MHHLTKKIKKTKTFECQSCKIVSIPKLNLSTEFLELHF
jgi:hypothetical protein